MATDIGLIIKNITEFYNFKDKTVIHVGAGGGQIIQYAQVARQVIAIDSDPAAIELLKSKVKTSPFAAKFNILQIDFYEIQLTADVVFFEFCLHEMTDPTRALANAQTLASTVLIFDHAPDSTWSWYVAETEKLSRSWQAIERYQAKQAMSFQAEQFFTNYEELFQKVKIAGPVCLQRIEKFRTETAFRIPMPSRAVLITCEKREGLNC